MICGHLSEGSAASYLEDLQPAIWRICGQLSGESAASYLEDLLPVIWGTVKIQLTQPSWSWSLG